MCQPVHNHINADIRRHDKIAYDPILSYMYFIPTRQGWFLLIATDTPTAGLMACNCFMCTCSKIILLPLKW